jgi:HEPN domain-containing protein
MSQLEDAKFDLVRHWMLRAEEDFSDAEELTESEESSSGEAGAQARHAVEKYLKAYLAWNEVEFSSVSDIPRLLDLVSAKDTKLSKSLRECAALEAFAPGDETGTDSLEEEPMPAKDALNLAGNAREEIRYALSDFLAAERDRLDTVDEPLETVLETDDEVRLSAARALLDEAGISHYTAGEGAHTVFDHISAIGPVHLQVAKEDAEAAREALESLGEVAPGEQDAPESLEGENTQEEGT